MPLYKNNPEEVLFLDIETVSQADKHSDLDATWQALWDEKSKFIRADDESAEAFYPKRAAIMAEFGKIVCISCAFLVNQGGRQLRVRSFAGDDEKLLLQAFADMLNRHFRDYKLCAHNGKEFDFPYLARRMVVNKVKLPNSLNTSGAKPWEVQHLDTMEMWKFGDRKKYTSLKLLTALFGIPTPKDDIDGSMVGEVYWQEKDLDRIVNYCQKDTISLARVFLRMEMLPDLEEHEIRIADA